MSRIATRRTLASVANTQTAYVAPAGNDSTGVVGNPALPFLTIDAALDAIQPGWTIQLALGTYAPITGDNQGGSSRLKACTIRGAARPAFKGDNTGLEGGSIIQGPFTADRNDVKLYSLGVDSGSAVCTAVYAGVAQEGLSLCNNIGRVVGLAGRTGLVAHDIIIICKAADAQVHAFLCENALLADIDNIETKYGTHGIVLFAVNTTATNLRTHNHQLNGVIIKSTIYAPCHDVTVNNVTMDGDASHHGLRLFVGDNVLDPVIYNIKGDNISGSGFTGVGGFVIGYEIAGGGGGDIVNTAFTNVTQNDCANLSLNVTSAPAFATVNAGAYDPLLAVDGFNDADGTSLDVHAAELAAAAWVEQAGQWITFGGVAKGDSGTVLYLAMQEIGAADGVVWCRCKTSSPSAHGFGIAVRGTDADNGIWVILIPGSTFSINKHEGGGDATLASTAFTVGTGVHEIKVTLSGASIVATVDGGSELSVTSSFNQAATKHGLIASGGTADSFFAWAFIDG